MSNYCDECGRPDDFSDLTTDFLIDELNDRGEGLIYKRDIEIAYEALLRGQTAEAARLLQGALIPNGGFDGVEFRLKRDGAFVAPGAHGQVGPSGADAKRAGEACPNEKAA